MNTYQDQGHDLRLVVFDLNGTLIRENSWYALNLALGVTPEEDAELLRLHRTGEITYQEGQRRLEQWYLTRGKASKGIIEEVLYSYTYFPHVYEIIRSLRDKGFTLAIVSGSIDLLTVHIAGELGIPHAYAANRLRFASDGRLIALDAEEDDSLFKAGTVRQLCRRLNIRMDQVAAVGDSTNDRKLFSETGHGITFPGTPLTDCAWRIIPDLSELKDLL